MNKESFKMELKEFIKESLIDICEGVGEARNKMKERLNNCPIAPAFINGKIEQNSMHSVEFDIATTVTDENKKSSSVNGKSKGIIKVIAADLGADVKINKQSSNEKITRIKFSVPIYLCALDKHNKK